MKKKLKKERDKTERSMKQLTLLFAKETDLDEHQKAGDMEKTSSTVAHLLKKLEDGIKRQAPMRLLRL